MRRRLTAIVLTLGTAALPLATMDLTTAAGASARDFIEIRSDMHDKCLATNGDNVEMQTCGRRGNQLWFWNGRTLVNAAENHCLDVRNGEINAPAQAVGDCHGNANQRWTHNVNTRELVPDVNPQCLSIQNNGERRDGAGINMRQCTRANWQTWHIAHI
ncbi:RICIN domain-containing protein [Streptomyces triculaminicus]|uniref:RICIN domain-containing protein n=1 Tax=Streptomyces triculaminicus TaxID=2816232 RepID=UPI0037D52A84